MKVNLDIAGMYYHREKIDVKDGATVKDVMQAAADLDKAKNDYRLNFSGETTPSGEFLSSIEITHLQPAVSRQLNTRKYPSGVYIGRDTQVSLVPSPVPGSSDIIASDDAEATSVLAWQYYVYDKHFVDKNRKLGSKKVAGSPDRTIIPYSKIDKNAKIEDGDTIVWRLVTIFVKPTHPLK